MNITACNSYTFKGIVRTSSGTYYDTLANAVGCDSVVTLNLTIKQSSAKALTISACNSYTFKGIARTSSGTYYDTLANAVGCDSVVTLNLTIKQSSAKTLTVSACNSYTFKGVARTSSGTYYDTLTNAVGCDSIVTLNLTIKQGSSKTLNVSACNSYTFKGISRTSSGTYYDTLANAVGCDSVVTLNLTIKQSSAKTLTVSACNSYTFKGVARTSSGTYYDTLTNAVGCDSIVTLNLTIKQSSAKTLTVSACNSYTFKGVARTSTGNYYDTLTNAVGCDSIVTLNLTIKQSSAKTLTVSACNSYTYKGVARTSTGTYYDTLTNAVGCDSIVTLQLTIKQTSANTITASACVSYTFNGNTLTTAGTYNDTLANAVGCDSVVTLNLTIMQSSSNSITASACVSYSFSGSTLTSSGTYYDTLTNAQGCDSVVTLNLTIMQTSASTITTSACVSYSFGGNTLTASGTYYDTLANAIGCDSVVTLSLSILQPNASTLSQTACDSFYFDGVYITASGQYMDTVANAAGCDSVITLNLVVHSLGLSLSANNLLCYKDSNGSITAQSSGGAGGYMYKLDNGNYQQSGIFNNLKAATYNITAKDSNGCERSGQVTLTQPSFLQATTTKTNVLCHGDSNGTISINAAGGVPPYQYNFNGYGYQTQSSISGLQAGTHSVSIRDTNGCVLGYNVNISQPQLLVLSNGAGLIGNAVPLMCFGDSVGSVTMAVTGGTKPYQYMLGNGAYQSSNTFGNLKAGSYLMTVKDSNNCTDTLAINIYQQSPLNVSSTVKPIMCFGDSNSVVTLSVSGGLSPYRYQLGSGNVQTSRIFNGLIAGSYNINISDSLGCLASVSVNITQPSALSINQTTTNILCFGDSTGSINVSANGGTSPYQYKIGNLSFQSVANFKNLKAGTHSITVMDSNGCITTQTTTITQPAAALSFNTNTGYSNCSNTSGYIAVSASGGTQGYQYKLNNGSYQASNLFNGLGAGNYTITVKDTNGCTKSATVNVPVTASLLSMSLSKVNPCCDGTNTGSIKVSAGGGAKPYTFLVMNSIDTVALTTDTIFENLNKEIYTFLLTDNNGCTLTKSIELREPSQMTPTITWTGATDTMWSNKANWNLNRLPKNTDSVHIPAGLAKYPTITISNTIHSLKIDNGAWLHCQNSGHLSINGTFSNRGTYKPYGGVLYMHGETGLPGGEYHALIINGKVSLCGNIKVNNAFNINAGKWVDNRGFNASGVADVTNNGEFYGNGKLILTRDYSYQTVRGGGSFSNVELNTAATTGARIMNSCSIKDTLTLTKGTLILYQYATLAVGVSGTSRGYISTSSGKLLSGNSLPSNLTIYGNNQSPKITNLKLQLKGILTADRPNGISLGENATADGLNLASGALDMNGYNLSLGSGNSANSIVTSSGSSIINSKNTGKLSIVGGSSSPAVSNLNLENMYQLECGRSNGISIGNSFKVSNLLNITKGHLDLNKRVITLDTLASLSEAGGGVRILGDSGLIETNRYFSSVFNNTNVAGMGLKLTTNAAINQGVFQRWHTRIQSGSGISIRRGYRIYSPASSVTISSGEFRYDTAELAGAAHNRLRLNKSIGSGWTNIPTTRSAVSANPALYFSNLAFNGNLYITASDSVISPLTPIYSSVIGSATDGTITIYPNPTTGDLNIAISNVARINTICLTDLNGKSIKTFNPSQRNINFAELAMGMYFLQIQTDAGLKVFKVVKL